MKSNESHLVVLLVLFVVAVLASPVSAGLIAHWTLDESPVANGTNIADTSGSATVHDGTLNSTGNAAAVPGKVGGAINFGAESYVLADLTTDFVSGSSPRTIAGWINPDTIDGGQSWLWSYGESSSGQHFGLTLENSNSTVGLLLRHFGGFVDYTAPTITANGAWFHVAQVVPVGATQVGDVKVYVNGVELTDKSESSNATEALDTQPNTTDSRGTQFAIGAIIKKLDANFDGQLDDIRFYDEALSQSEIAALVPEPSTLALATVGLLSLVAFAWRRRK